MKKLYVMVMAVLAIMLMTSCTQKQEQEIQEEPIVNEIVSERVFTYALGEETYTVVATVIGDHDTMLAESDYIDSLLELISSSYDYCVENDMEISVPIVDSIIIYRDYSRPGWSVYTDICNVYAHMYDTGEKFEWEGNLFDSLRTEYTVVERDVTWQ